MHSINKVSGTRADSPINIGLWQTAALCGRRKARFVPAASTLTIRSQLTMYLPQPIRGQVDAVRRLLDPVQADLIPAHVTLCREDELESLDPALLGSRLAAVEAKPVTLSFGPAEPFQGHGILLPCVAGEPDFRAMRQWLLGSPVVKHQAPHITLAHPRNPRAPDNSVGNADAIPREFSVRLASVYRIRRDGASAWQVTERYSPGDAGRRDA